MSGGFLPLKTPTSAAYVATAMGSAAQSANVAGAAKLATPLTRGSSAARQIASAPAIPAPTNHAPPPAASSEAFATTTSRSSSQPLSEKLPAEFPTPLRQHAMTRHPESDASRSDNATRVAGISSGGPLSTGNP